MSDWQPGDLALCVNDAPIMIVPVHVRKGCIYTVEAVVFFHAEGLHLQNTDVGSAYFSSRFVKITPGHKITGSEVDQREPWKVGV